MSGIRVQEGSSTLVVSLPHTGTEVPPEVWRSLNERGRALADTDWQVDRLYQDLVPQVTWVQTPFHRYVIDVNRDPRDVSLYPGANTTGLCPEIDFEGQPIYQPGREPDEAERQQRLVQYHQPYHQRLAAQLDRVRRRHGHAVLYDAHSIRSPLPFLFEGELPELNVGTYGGASCHEAMAAGVVELCRQSGRSWVLNGRFQGGWTTRHYGKPAEQVHAIQMELAQSTYLQSGPPWNMLETRAEALRPLLKQILEFLQAWSPS